MLNLSLQICTCTRSYRIHIWMYLNILVSQSFIYVMWCDAMFLIMCLLWYWLHDGDPWKYCTVDGSMIYSTQNLKWIISIFLHLQFTSFRMKSISRNPWDYRTTSTNYLYLAQVRNTTDPQFNVQAYIILVHQNQLQTKLNKPYA